MIDNWIEQLSKELELPRTLPKEGNGYFFPLDEQIGVLISNYEQGFSFACTLGQCPTQKTEEFFTQAMLANLFGQGTKGAVLGLSDDYNAVTLALEVPYADEYGVFKDKLEDFLNAVDFWRDEIKAATTPQ